MGVLSLCITLLAVSSGSFATKLPVAFSRGSLSPSFTGRSNGYLPPVNDHCVPTTVTEVVTAEPEVRVQPPATVVRTETAIKQVLLTETLIHEVAMPPVTTILTKTRTSSTIRVQLTTQVPLVVFESVTRSIMAPHITPPPYTPAPVTPVPVTPTAVTSVALTMAPGVTATAIQTVTPAPITPPAVVLPPVTPAPVVPADVIVTRTHIHEQDVKVETPQPVTRQITVTRSLPAVTSTVTTCGYSYPEPERQLQF